MPCVRISPARGSDKQCTHRHLVPSVLVVCMWDGFPSERIRAPAFRHGTLRA